MNKQTLNPWTWQDQLGYAQGILVSNAHQTLYAAGQGSVDRDGNLVHEGDVAGQAIKVMDNIEAVLAAGRMTLPAGGIATQVPALAMPGMLVEITVTAAR